MSTQSSWFSRYILPGFILKATIIGGGYMSGRELEQYFATHGPIGGLLGMSIATLILCLVFAATLEFARVHRSYDYRTFFKNLLGPGWILFELLYFALTFVALSVLTSVAGNTTAKVTGWPLVACECGFMACVAILLYFGTKLVEQFLSLWSFVLYAAFAALVFLSFWRFGGRIADSLETSRLTDLGGIAADGATYAGYNIAGMTATLFCVRHIGTRRDAVIAGFLGGPLAMVAGMLFFLAMAGYDQEMRAQVVPVEFLLGKLGVPAFRVFFLSVMAVTLLGTCSAMIHAINERFANTFAAAKRKLPGWGRSAIATAIMISSVFIAAKFGLVALVAQGYKYLAWGFIAIYVIPILIYGVWTIGRAATDEVVGPAD